MWWIPTASEGQILRRPVREGKKKHVYSFFIQFCIFFSFEIKDLMFLQIVSGIWGHWVSEYGFQSRGILNHSHPHPEPFSNFFSQNFLYVFCYLNILGSKAWIGLLRESAILMCDVVIVKMFKTKRCDLTNMIVNQGNVLRLLVCLEDKDF